MKDYIAEQLYNYITDHPETSVMKILNELESKSDVNFFRLTDEEFSDLLIDLNFKLQAND